MQSSSDAAAAATEAAAASPARTFSQVVFTDIPHSYPPSTPVTCCYTLVEGFRPNPRDWVGVFKVGWSTTKDYHTFVWVETSSDVEGQQSATRNAVFKEYYLPKDEIEFYQFCYVDSTCQVRGASTPFCFKAPVEKNMESSMDDDLLVITTQEQVEQGIREKAEMMNELDQMKEENITLRRSLQKEQQEIDSLKGKNGQKEKEMSELMKELDQIKEQNENFKYTLQEQLKETARIKEEMLVQLTKQMEMQQQSSAEQQKVTQSSDGAPRQNEEKYNRAVTKINLLKKEREELKGKVEVQSDEIAKLNSKIREEERELSNMKDSMQLLQVDLQASEKEKARLATELQWQKGVAQGAEEAKRENQELSRRLSQQETQQQSGPDEDLKAQLQTLLRQLQEAQAKLATAKEESKNSKEQVKFLETELQQTREQLEGAVASQEQLQRSSNKQELKLREAHGMIAEKDAVMEDQDRTLTLVKQENEDLRKENQDLKDDIEEQHRINADLRAAAPSCSSTTEAVPASPGPDCQQEAAEQSVNMYENVGSIEEPEEEQLLVCHHCQESFPGITQKELEIHEQSHRICPFCTMVCDHMEQSAFEDHVYGHEL